MNKKRFFFGIEEFILVSIILLNILDALEILPPDIDFIKKIISWSGLGYLLYKATLSELFFGKKDKTLDKIIIIGLFMFITKNLVAYANAIVTNFETMFFSFYEFLITNASTIEELSILFGFLILIYVSIKGTLEFDNHNKSILSLFVKNKGKSKTLGDSLKRIILSFLILNAFLLFVFNLMMEWLAISIDAPLLMIGLVIFIFAIARKSEKFDKDGVIFKLGNYGNRLYYEIIESFKYKERIIYGLAGILCLHLLTDLLVFVWPFIFGLTDSLYLGVLPDKHLTLFELIRDSNNIISTLIYALNTITLIFLLVFPIKYWYNHIQNKVIKFSKTILSIFLFSLPFFIFNPIFIIERFNGNTFVGIDIQTISTTSNNIITPLIIGSILTVLVIFFVEQKDSFNNYFGNHYNTRRYFNIHNFKNIINQTLKGIVSLSVLLFFTYYILLYAIDIIMYYFETISFTLSQNNIFLFVYLSLFLLLTIIFYIGSLVIILCNLIIPKLRMHSHKFIR